MKPLPPVVERSFIDSEIEEVKSALNDNGKMEILRLYRSAQAFAFYKHNKLSSKEFKIHQLLKNLCSK